MCLYDLFIVFLREMIMLDPGTGDPVFYIACAPLKKEREEVCGRVCHVFGGSPFLFDLKKKAEKVFSYFMTFKKCFQ